MRLPITQTSLHRTFQASAKHNKLATSRYLKPVSVVQTRKMASGDPQAMSYSSCTLLTHSAANDLNIENTNIKTASGVTLDEQQKTLVGSVLDVRRIHLQPNRVNPHH